MSLPTRERELKLRTRRPGAAVFSSLPTRERELKRVRLRRRGRDCKSLPTRERELKLVLAFHRRLKHGVAPYTGA